jgi:hypothetical protein
VNRKSQILHASIETQKERKKLSKHHVEESIPDAINNATAVDRKHKVRQSKIISNAEWGMLFRLCAARKDQCKRKNKKA